MFTVYVDEQVKCTGCGYRGLVEDDGLCGQCWADKIETGNLNSAEFDELFSH